MPTSPLSRLAMAQTWVDPVADRLQPLIRRAVAPRAVHNALDGVWFGAPLHPALTDVPLGSWTAALLLDAAALIGRDERMAAAADRVLAVGTLATLPAAVAGLNDVRDLRGQSRRMAMVHGLANAVGLTLMSASTLSRARGRRGRGRVFGAAGYLVSGTAAHLGGKLSFGLGIRVNRTVGEPVPDAFVDVLDASELRGGELRRVDVDGVPVLLARTGDGVVRALANTCTHLGGPLNEGRREDDTVICPWHASRFDLHTGAVIDGPAVFALPCLEARERDGRIEVGRPGAGRAAEAVELPELSVIEPVGASV